MSEVRTKIAARHALYRAFEPEQAGSGPVNIRCAACTFIRSTCADTVRLPAFTRYCPVVVSSMYIDGPNNCLPSNVNHFEPASSFETPIAINDLSAPFLNALLFVFNYSICSFIIRLIVDSVTYTVLDVYMK